MKPVILVECARDWHYEHEPQFFVDNIVYTDEKVLYARYLELVDEFGDKIREPSDYLSILHLEEAISNATVGSIIWLGIQGFSFGMDRGPIGCKIVDIN